MHLDEFFIPFFNGFSDLVDDLLTVWKNTYILSSNVIGFDLTVFDLLVTVIVVSLFVSALVPLVRVRMITLNNRYY